MTDPLRARVIRAIEALPDERVYQVLDYLEFLESKYAERARPTNIFARFVDTVGDTMRAGRVPLETISGTLGAMDSAQKLMQGLAAAGEAVIDEMGRAVAPPPSASKGAAPAGTKVPLAPPPTGTAPPAAGPPPAGAPPAGTQPVPPAD